MIIAFKHVNDAKLHSGRIALEWAVKHFPFRSDLLGHASIESGILADSLRFVQTGLQRRLTEAMVGM